MRKNIYTNTSLTDYLIHVISQSQHSVLLPAGSSIPKDLSKL